MPAQRHFLLGPSVFGQSVTFNGDGDTPPRRPLSPTGTVTFYDNGVPIGTAAGVVIY